MDSLSQGKIRKEDILAKLNFVMRTQCYIRKYYNFLLSLNVTVEIPLWTFSSHYNSTFPKTNCNLLLKSSHLYWLHFFYYIVSLLLFTFHWINHINFFVPIISSTDTNRTAILLNTLTTFLFKNTLLFRPLTTDTGQLLKLSLLY